MTFRMENGEEQALKVKEQDYAVLKEGSSWTVTWQGEELVSFEA